MNYFIFGFLPFVTVVIFVIGMILRLYSWIKVPQPGALTLFPAPTNGSESFRQVLKETLFFPSLFKGDKTLWLFAWLFHLSLAFIFIGHVRVLTDFPALWAALGINADTMSAVGGGIAGVIVLVFALLLVLRRMIILRVREITNFSDFISLLIIIAILVTGNIMRFGEHFDLEITRGYFSSLLTFSLSSSVIPQNSMFTLHFLLAQLLIMFIPFSKILHFGGIFFTKTIIQKS